MPEIENLFTPNSYGDIEMLLEKYNENKYLLVSFENFTDQVEAQKLKDFLLGMTYAKQGIAYQYGNIVLFSYLKDVDIDDTLNLSSFTWREVNKFVDIHEKMDFGTVGIKIGDKVSFKDSDIGFLVASGNGTPGNGGTMVKYEDRREIGGFSLLYMTRRLLGGIIPEKTDIFELWTYKDETLRSIHNRNMGK